MSTPVDQNTPTGFPGLKSGILFDTIEHDPELEEETNAKLAQLLALAPPGASVSGAFEKSGNNVLFAIDIKSSFRSFSARTIGNTPRSVVRRALERMETQLCRWRFGIGNNGKTREASGISNLPWARNS